MNWELFIAVLLGTGLVCGIAAVILTSVYADQGVGQTARELWQVYFGQGSGDLSQEANPKLEKEEPVPKDNGE